MSRDLPRAARAIEDFLVALGHDPTTDPDLRETGARVAEAWATELLAGEQIDVPAMLRQEAIDGPSDGTWVVLRDHATHLVCPHHLLPALGDATMAYRPRGRIVGLGALARVVDAHTRRLALQETAGARIAADLSSSLEDAPVAVRLRMRHACLTARGERSAGTIETWAFARVDHEPAIRVLLGGA